MKSINYILWTVLTINLGYSQIDLSLEWEFQEDLSYFDSVALNYIVNDEISQLEFIYGIIVIHQGKIVSEQYYNGSSVSHIFNIWSVTKSYTSTLLGQAFDMGMINDPDSSASYFFPDYNIDYLETISLHDLLTMSSGYIDGFYYPYWYIQSTETLVSMIHSSPGSFFYNNSACHLNSHAIYYASDMTPIEFANSYLFPYLGIENPVWNSGYLGINDGSASLHLNLRDMVKLGQLYIQDGLSGDIQVVSSEWINRATSIHVQTGYWGNYGLPGYGYLWWLPYMEGTYLAFGYGGQFIAVIPEYNLIIGSHSTDWGPSDVNIHAINLLGIIFSEIVPMFEKADINDDSIVNILDIIMVVNFILSIDVPTNSEYFASDINSDEIINIIDIIEIVQVILNQ